MTVSTDELQRIHERQARTLRAAQAEEAAIISRWCEVHQIVDELKLSQQRIEQMLLERSNIHLA